MPTLNEHDAERVRRIHEQIEAIRRDDYSGQMEPGRGLPFPDRPQLAHESRQPQYAEAK